MKNLLIFFSLFFCFGFLHAQNNEETIESVNVLIRNDKGKAVGKVFVHTASAPLYQLPGEDGTAKIYPKKQDIIYVTVNNYVGTIPYAGEKSLEVIFGKNTFSDPSGKTYATTKLPRFNEGKIYTNPNIESYGSLIFLIAEKYPAVLLLDRSGTYQAYLFDAHTRQDVSRGSGRASIDQAMKMGGGAAGALTVKVNPNSQESDANDPNAASVYVDGKLYPNIHLASNAVKLSELVEIKIDQPDSFSGKGGTGTLRITTLNESK